MSSNRTMAIRPGFLISGFLVASCAFSQIIGFPGQYPGQYPGGQYPGGQYPGGQSPYPQGGSGSPFPRRGRNTTTQDNQAPVITFAGVLRRISNHDLVIQSDDKRIVTISTANATKYYKASGGNGSVRDFNPGDQITVDTNKDDNDFYHALRITQVRAGTAEERAAASQPVDDSPIASGDDKGSSDGPPKLRRAASPDNGDSPTTSSASDSDGPPRMRRAAGSDSAQTDSRGTVSAPSQSSSTAAPPDPTDPGPPVLKRGAPRSNSSSDSTPVVADNRLPASADSAATAARPSIHAQEVNGVTQAPPAPRIGEASSTSSGSLSLPSSGDPVIDKAREAAFSFSETLPNYTVKQFTTRFETESAHGGQTSWQPIDNVTADVVSENGKENYKNILINGKPPKEAIEKTGTWSTGEFSSVLQDILLPQTNADFHNKRSTTIVNRAAFRYDFSVEQPNSHWHIYASAQSYLPEYTGAIWVDKENYRVLRIELSARNMPKAFPLDTVESAVDYDYVLIGDGKFLLPVHSESLSCERGTSICSRNVIDFRNYKKFGADTSITFDSDAAKP